MKVTAIVSLGVRYTVTRNVDGTGANAWPADAVFIVMGKSGDGRIILDGTHSPHPAHLAGDELQRPDRTNPDRRPQRHLGLQCRDVGHGYRRVRLRQSQLSSPKRAISKSATTPPSIIRFAAGGNNYIEGGLELGTGGSLRSGATSFGVGTGWWMDYNGGTPQFRVGNPAGNRLSWNGTTLTIVGEGSGITNIDGGNIQTGSITATQITGSELSAIYADLGSITGGQIVLGSANKFWMNEGDDGVLAIGGTVKGSAPFHVTSTGTLSATGATISGVITATSGSIGTLSVTGDLTVSTGKILAGSGDVTIDASGILINSGKLNQNKIRLGNAQLYEDAADTSGHSVGYMMNTSVAASDREIRIGVDRNYTQSYLSILSTSAGVSTLSFDVGGSKFSVTNAGNATVAAGLNVGGAIAIGGDVTLYRTATNVLRTNDSFIADQGIYAGSGAITVTGGDIIAERSVALRTGILYWGTSYDTSLYRQAAQDLRTNGQFTAAWSVTAKDWLYGTNGLRVGSTGYFTVNSGGVVVASAPIRLRMYMASSLTVPVAWTGVPFAYELYDTDNMHSGTAQSSTVHTEGLYHIHAQAEFSYASGRYSAMRLRLHRYSDGSTMTLNTTSGYHGGGYSCYLECNTDWYMAVNDYFWLEVFNSTTGGYVTANYPYSCHIMANRIV